MLDVSFVLKKIYKEETAAVYHEPERYYALAADYISDSDVQFLKYLKFAIDKDVLRIISELHSVNGENERKTLFQQGAEIFTGHEQTEKQKHPAGDSIEHYTREDAQKFFMPYCNAFMWKDFLEYFKKEGAVPPTTQKPPAQTSQKAPVQTSQKTPVTPPPVRPVTAQPMQIPVSPVTPPPINIPPVKPVSHYTDQTNQAGQNNGPKGGVGAYVLAVIIGIIVSVVVVLASYFVVSRLLNNKDVKRTPSYSPVVVEEPAEDQAKEPARETDKEPLTATLLTSEPSFDHDQYKTVDVISASASSIIDQEDFVNDPMVMFDGLTETSWQEGVDGYGIGEYAECYFDGEYDVKYICFKLGNWRTYDMFTSNAIPGALRITMGDFSQVIEFEPMGDQTFDQWIEFSSPVSADSIRITIVDVWPGKEYDDTCIAEVTLYGEKV